MKQRKKGKMETGRSYLRDINVKKYVELKHYNCKI